MNKEPYHPLDSIFHGQPRDHEASMQSHQRPIHGNLLIRDTPCHQCPGCAHALQKFHSDTTCAQCEVHQHMEHFGEQHHQGSSPGTTTRLKYPELVEMR